MSKAGQDLPLAQPLEPEVGAERGLDGLAEHVRREQVQLHQMQLRDRLAEERGKLEGIQDELVRLEREIAGSQ
mgnify:CR=1 FL=1